MAVAVDSPAKEVVDSNVVVSSVEGSCVEAVVSSVEVVDISVVVTVGSDT